MDNVKNIEDQSNRYQIIWDLGRRCSYACSYCPPHRNNKTSAFVSYETLCNTMDYIADYANLYDQFRKEDALKKLSFTGGEPTVHPDFFKFLKYVPAASPNLKNISPFIFESFTLPLIPSVPKIDCIIGF